LSNRDRKDSAPELKPLRPRRDSTRRFIAWGMAPVKGDECCRWESADGRWVALTLGTGDELGQVIVTDSSGRREQVHAYEDALKTAKTWRT
jgi:hypothetical protein